MAIADISMSKFDAKRKIRDATKNWGILLKWAMIENSSQGGQNDSQHGRQVWIIIIMDFLVINTFFLIIIILFLVIIVTRWSFTLERDISTNHHNDLIHTHIILVRWTFTHIESSPTTNTLTMIDICAFNTEISLCEGGLSHLKEM